MGFEGVGVGVGLGVGVASGVGVAVGVGVGTLGEGGMIIDDGMDGEREFGAVRYGMKFNVPKLTGSFLWSQIVWLIAEASVVPHQLLVAFMSYVSVK